MTTISTPLGPSAWRDLLEVIETRLIEDETGDFTLALWALVGELPERWVAGERRKLAGRPKRELLLPAGPPRLRVGGRQPLGEGAAVPCRVFGREQGISIAAFAMETEGY